MTTTVPAFDGLPEAPAVFFFSTYTKFKHFAKPANCIQASLPATSLSFSASEMFRCLLQGLPKLNCVLAANTKMGEVTVFFVWAGRAQGFNDLSPPTINFVSCRTKTQT